MKINAGVTVGITTRIQVWHPGFIPSWAINSSNRNQTGTEANITSSPMGTEGSFLRGEVDHSPPPSTGVRHVWGHTPTPPQAAKHGA